MGKRCPLMRVFCVENECRGKIRSTSHGWSMRYEECERNNIITLVSRESGHAVFSSALAQLATRSWAQKDVEFTRRKEWPSSQVSNGLGILKLCLTFFHFADITSSPVIATMPAHSVPPSSHPLPHPRPTPLTCIEEQQPMNGLSSCLPVPSRPRLLLPPNPKMLQALTR